MKNRLMCYFGVALCFMIGTSNAQELPNIVPPTPEAASLGKFTEVPVSHYTGLPNISVPIASYEVGGKSFPVSISYHARGLKVEESASRVGLGWALNAGGQISRQTRMKADDASYGFFGSSMASDYANLPTDSTLVKPYLETCCSSSGSFDPDKIPDQFNLQIGSVSAKFIFNYKDSKPLVQNFDDIIINEISTPNRLTGFEVIDKEGFKYTFTKTNSSSPEESYIFTENTSTYTSNNGTGIPVVNSWHITTIESPDGDIANFIYHEEIIYSISRSYDEYYQNQQGTGHNSHASRTKLIQQQLKEIRYNYSGDGATYKKIVFEGIDTRQDVRLNGSNYPKELDEVKSYDRHGQVISSFSLHHSYMNSNETNNYHELLVQLDPLSSKKRLVLDSITEYGQNGISKPPYKFDYNNTPLPNKFSNSQDFWGYYNGSNNGRFLNFGGSSRIVDTTYAEAGMLKKISYPTGGSTRFSYEHNRGYRGQEYSDITFPMINPVGLNDEVRLTHLNDQFYNGTAYVRDFTVGSMSGFATINIQLPDWTNLSNSPNPGYDQNVQCSSTNAPTNCNFQIKVENLDNSTIYNLYTNSSPISLPQGNYRLTVDPIVNNWQLPPYTLEESLIHSFIVSLTWSQQVLGENGILYSSGKRIKQIEFLDSGDNVVSKKTYDYNDSGVILSVPYFAVPHHIFGQLGGLSGGPAIPGSPFNTYQGNTIGYRLVDEYYGDKTENIGKTSYRFLVTPDSGDYLSFPVTPPTDNEWLRGLPVEVIHYKRTNAGAYLAVKKSETTYLCANDNHENVLPQILGYANGTPNNLFTPETLNHHIDSIPNVLPDVFYQKTNLNYRLPIVHRYRLSNVAGDPTYIKVYHFTGGTLDTGSTIETNYDDNENITLVTETQTAYNYAKHYQASSVRTVTSDGEPIFQTFTYPQELVSGYSIHPSTYSSNPITALAEQHRFVPLETSSLVDSNDNGVADLNEELNKTKTIYDWDGDILEPY
ncbi:hypothetical protein, partial [Winogradskyella sp.]